MAAVRIGSLHTNLLLALLAFTTSWYFFLRGAGVAADGTRRGAGVDVARQACHVKAG